MSENVFVADLTMKAIDAAIERDQGAAFRVFSGQVLPHMEDAYRGEDKGFRSHLGASLIGRECARDIWYGFRWAHKANFNAKTLRLFNRGHLEEARFIAMLLTIGCAVYQQDENGHQFRISEFGGHFGGSGDGLVIGLPDLPAGTTALCEFKTHGDSSFKKLMKEGLRESKPEHYSQMQIYMHKMGIQYGLYMAVNKNTDHIMAYIVVYDGGMEAMSKIDRAEQIIFTTVAPSKVSNMISSFKCKYCDKKGICYLNEPIEVNCRTCENVSIRRDGSWVCGITNKILSTEMQLIACECYKLDSEF